MMKKILLLNGPNLNLLGTREPELYGSETLEDVENKCKEKATSLGFELLVHQENSEGALIDHIHAARGICAGIIINPGGYSHTSVSIRDALSGVDLPVFEVHISNIHAREPFRHQSLVSGVAVGVICGFGTAGYLMALDGMANSLNS